MPILRPSLFLTILMLGLAPASHASEVVVGYKSNDGMGSRVISVPAGQNTQDVINKIKKNPLVAYAAPNIQAHAAWVPNDTYFSSQWNFSPTNGVAAAAGWDQLISVGRAGASGVKIAVLDSGIAYLNRGLYKRSPDFAGTVFSDAWDFITNTAYPVDLNGHGTHVAGTIAESANNSFAMAGLAWGATIMPVRILDKQGNGSSVAIEKGIRWAANHGAKVINLSIEFPPSTTAAQIPGILGAIDYATSKGSLVVAAAGNYGLGKVTYPAAYPKVLAVGATTDHRCLASYSDHGPGLDLVAPGGGPDLLIKGDAKCNSKSPEQKNIVQVGLDTDSADRVYVPYRFVLRSASGTSMAAPHVAAAAAMVIASGVIGANPSAAAVANRLVHTARPLGLASYYGAGMVDVARATNPLLP